MEGVETVTHATNVRSVISSVERCGPSQVVENNVKRLSESAERLYTSRQEMCVGMEEAEYKSTLA